MNRRARVSARTLREAENWDAAWQAGYGMSIDQAIAYALEVAR
jgi:hypothetical protein